MLDLEQFELEPDILVLDEFFPGPRTVFFKFEHTWLDGNDPSLELQQDVMLEADELWKVDLRPPLFKGSEQKRRRLSRIKWNAMISWDCRYGRDFTYACRSELPSSCFYR